MSASNDTNETPAHPVEAEAMGEVTPSESASSAAEICPHCRQGTLYAVRYESYDQWRKLFKLKPHFCTHCDARVYRW